MKTTAVRQAPAKPGTEQPQEKKSACKEFRGFFRGRCNDCKRLEGESLNQCREYLQWFARIPYFIIDCFMPQTTGDEWKILDYIVRHADFNPSSNNFGKAFVKYAEITAATNIQQPGRCLRKLEKLDLIRKIHTRRSSKEGITTLNTIIVRWMKPLAQLNEAKNENRKELDKQKPTTRTKALAWDRVKKNFSESEQRAITRFFDAYDEAFGARRRYLTKEQWARVKSSIFSDGRGDEIDPGDFEDMLDNYFGTTYQEDCDHWILHFIEDGVRGNLTWKYR